MTKEDAPSAGQGDEGDDRTNRQKEDQIVSSILPETEAVHQAIRMWAGDYAARLAEIRDKVRNHPDFPAATVGAAEIDQSEDQLVDVVVSRWGWEPPALPKALWPAWAVEAEVSPYEMGGETVVLFRGRSYGQGYAAVHLSHGWNIVTNPSRTREGIALGTVVPFENSPSIEFECETETIWEVEDAEFLGKALIDIAPEMRVAQQRSGL